MDEVLVLMLIRGVFIPEVTKPVEWLYYSDEAAHEKTHKDTDNFLSRTKYW
jgi:hypothetical protein